MSKCKHVPCLPGVKGWTFCWRCQCIMKQDGDKWVYVKDKEVDSSVADNLIEEAGKNWAKGEPIRS